MGLVLSSACGGVTGPSTWQVHLVQLSTIQSSLSSNRRPSCQHKFFSLVSFILTSASFIKVFSSVCRPRHRNKHTHTLPDQRGQSAALSASPWCSRSDGRNHVRDPFFLCFEWGRGAHVRLLLINRTHWARMPQLCFSDLGRGYEMSFSACPL